MESHLLRGESIQYISSLRQESTPVRIAGRIIVTTYQSGQLVLDDKLLSLFFHAQGHSLDEILGIYAADQNLDTLPDYQIDELRAALACLVSAGLLERATQSPPANYPTQATGNLENVLVSTIIVNYNSLNWLQQCLNSVNSQRYHPIEIIVVDNCSIENPAPWLEKNYPAVRILRLGKKQSLAAAINQGITLANGDFFFILNPDTWVDPNAVTEMVRVARENNAGYCAGVAAKIKYSWAPGFLNGLGNRVGFSSWGADNAQGHLDLGQFDGWSEVPSLCFAAALIPRHAWEVVGRLDEGFPLYYEDVDWSYRARLLGYCHKLAPNAVVFHVMGQRIHSSQEVDLSPVKLFQVTYGRLRFATKIFSSKNLLRVMVTSVCEDTGRMILNLLKGRFRHVNASFSSWKMFMKHRVEIRQLRTTIQKQRTVSDRQVLSLQGSVPPPLIWRGIPELSWDIVQHTYLPLMQTKTTSAIPEFSIRTRLLIISQDIIAEKMAGTGLRYLEMARALCRELDVTLAFPGSGSQSNIQKLEIPSLHLIPIQFEHPQDIQALVKSHDVILLSSFILEKIPSLALDPSLLQQPRRVIDLYDPLVLENLHYYQDESISIQESFNQQSVNIMNRLIQVGDFFICGNERQRDFWIGVLAANGRINPKTVKQDASLRKLIDVVGVGFPDRPPSHQPLLRGIHPAFPPESRIVVWGGGLWDWLDPLSLVKAWPQVLQLHPETRLVFLGTRHPNPFVPQHKIAVQTESLASEIGEKDKTIFFFEWLALTDRESLLCEADIGVALHPLSIETRYSIRTRVLDYFWAHLPVLVSDGDVTSEWVRQYGLGEVIPPQDISATATALINLLGNSKESYSPAFSALRSEFSWSNIVEPLRQYCLRGSPSADQGLFQSFKINRGSQIRIRVARAKFILHNEGWRVLLHRLWRYLQWIFSH